MAIDLSKMTLPEIFKHISELKQPDRVKYLPTICNLKPEVKEILRMVFNKSVQFELPEGSPPYNRQDEIPDNWGYNRLPKELRKFKYFVKGETININQIKRESIFIDMLESLSPEEADLVLMIKDKKLKYKGITRSLVEKTIPEIFDGETLGK